MFAGFNSYKSKPLVEAAIEGRALRQRLIASNVANIDTPFYKAKDVDFETALINKKNEIYYKKNDGFKLTTTNDKHFQSIDFPQTKMPTIYLRDGHLMRNDANTVDLDVEMSELSKNSIMVQALDAANKKYSDIFKQVIDSSSKI